MAMSDGEQKETLGYLRESEEYLQAHKPNADPDLYELLKRILNVCKRLAGDRAPLVE